MNALRSALPSTGVTVMSEVAIGSRYHGEAAGTVEEELAIGLAAGVAVVQRADLHREAPAAALALDLDQVVARAAVAALARRRRRAHAQDGNRTVRAHDARDLATMIVAVQDRLAADPPDH